MYAPSGGAARDFRASMRRRVMLMSACAAGACAAGLSGCAEIGSGPNVPAAIEFTPFAAPSVVIGDTLRDINGQIAPIRAIVRNVDGNIIEDAPVRYLYADANRDTALRVDSATGVVYAVKSATATARLAARVGDVLQVIQNVIVTTRPDSVAGDTVVTALVVPLRDTVVQSSAATATVLHKEGTAVSGVNAWLVRFELVSPANATNDTTAAVYLVDENGRASTLDTTSTTGAASRSVRVRSARFPATAVDTVVIRAHVLYRGVNVANSPRTFRIVVRRATT